MTRDRVAVGGGTPLQYRDHDVHQLVVRDPGVGWLNSNDRRHWRSRSAATRAWCDAAAWEAKAARLPMLVRVHVFADVRCSPRARVRDPGNWYPTAKACIDGIVRVAGRLLPDDDAEHLVGPDMRLGVPVPSGTPVRLHLWIVDLDSHPPTRLRAVVS